MADIDIDDQLAQFRASAAADVAQQKQQTLSTTPPPLAPVQPDAQPQQAMQPDETIDDTIATFRKQAANDLDTLNHMQRVGAVTQSITDAAKAATLPPDATDQVKAAGSYDAFTQAMIAHAQTANGVLFGGTPPLPPGAATKEDAGLDDETSPTAHANALQAMREASPDYVRPGVVPAIGRVGSGVQAGAVEGVTQAAQGLSVLFNDKPYLEPFYGQYLDVPKMSADELTAFRAKITAAWRSGSITQAESNRLQSDISDAHSGEPLLNPSEFAGVAPEDSASWKAAEAWKQKWLPTVTNAEKGTFTYQLGQMAGSAAVVLPASIAAGVVGGPGAAIAVGGAMMGAQGAQQGYEDARSLLRDQQTNFPPTQRNYDADAQRQQAQTQIEYAKKQGALSGVLGSIDVGVVLRPIERAAPGITSWALAKLQHMAQSGVTFATVGEAQTALGAELKKDIDPNAQYDFDWQRVAQELITGTAMGVAAPTHLSEEARNDLAEREASNRAGVTNAFNAFNPQDSASPTHRIMSLDDQQKLAATVALSPEAQTARSVDSLAAVQPPEERPATAAPAKSADDHAREIAPEAFDKRDSLIKRIQWYDEALGTQHGAIAQGHAQLVNDHFDEQVHPLNDQLEKLNDRLDAANREPGKHGLKETLRGKINDLTTQVQAIEDERGKSLANLPVGDDTWTRKILDARAQASKDLYDLSPTLRAARDEGERRVLAEQPVADTQAANEPGPAEQTAEPIAETPTPVMPTSTPEVEAVVKQALADEVKRSTTTDEHTRAIANDVSTQLTRVGYSPDVATAMGHMAATAYRVRANRWGGARGTALDLYSAERMTHQSYRDLEKKDRKQRSANREKTLAQDTLYQNGPKGPGPVWYSALTRSVEATPQEKASPAQWLATIKNARGIKAEELAWSGIEDWLKGQTGSVTKADLLDHLRENGVQVNEIVHGGGEPQYDADGAWTGNTEPSTKFGQHVLPGGRNYREMLLTLPTPSWYYKGRRDAPSVAAAAGLFRSQHWDEPNVLAHVRFDDRAGPNGEKILHIAEVQSDWHQTGRKRGYKNGDAIRKEMQSANDALYKFIADQSKPGVGVDEIRAMPEYKDIEARAAAAKAKLATPGVPDAPFKTTWPELAMKRMIRYAAEHGYDRISWDTGDTNADRYDLSHHLDRIQYVKEGNKWRVRAYPRNDPNTIMDLGRSQLYSLEEVADTFGKEIADKMEQGQGTERSGRFNSGMRDLTGGNLRVGGEGMRAFYDKQLPLVANKIGKKFGAKVEPATVKSETVGKPFISSNKEVSYTEDHDAHSLPITPEMRESVMDGQPLFQAEAENEEPKGMINWKGTRAFITYLRHADASTALHEVSHHLIEMMRLDAEDPHAPQDIKDDIAKLREYVGNQNERGGFTREQHEKLADSLEQYYFDGRAPSPELKPIFERLRQWMKQIYDEIVGKGIKIPDDVRAVFDRMFAERPERQEVAESQTADAVHPAEAIADMHEADAAHATTQDAEHVGDTVDEETVKTATDHAPETGIEHVGPEGQIDASARDAGADSSAGKGAKSEPGRAGSSQATDAQRELPGRSAAEVDGPRPGGSDRLDDGSGANSGTAAKRSGPDRAGNINLDTLNSTADAKNLIRQLVAQNTDFFNDKRFGSAAYQLQAEIAAARQLFEAVTKQTVAALKKWRASGDENDALAYHKSTEQMLLAAGEVSQYASMWGRAGSSFKKLSKIRPGETPEQFIKRTTGMTLFQLADEATAVDGLDTPDQRLGLIADNRRWRWKNGKSYLLALYINNLISGPITHAAYTAANYVTAITKAGLLTPLEAGLGKLHGADDQYRARLGEVGRQFSTIWKHLGDPAKGTFEAARTVMFDAPRGLTSAGRAFSTGVPFMEGQYAMDVREKIDAQAHASAETAGFAKDSDAYQQHVDAYNERPPQNVLDAAKAEAEAQYNVKQQVIPGFAGRVVEAPGRAVSMLHQMMYGMNYESEIARRAYRSAAAEDLAPGTDEFNAYVAQFTMHPPDADVAGAHDEALDMMLMHRSPYDSSMMHLQRWANSNVLAKIIMPFVKIGSNILRRNFLEMTPLGYLAPDIRADLMGKNGTIKRSAAEAKVIVGTTMAAGVFGLAASGLITGGGPADHKEAAMWRAAGNRPYTMTIGGEQIPYKKYLPFGLLWGTTADLYEVGKAGLGQGGGFEKAAATLGFAMSEAVVDETWMSGMSRFMDAIHSNDQAKGMQYIRDTAMSFIPYSVGVTQVARIIDPYQRYVDGWLSAFKSHMPGLSETLYPKIDTWGRPILSHMMTGVSADHNDPISTEAERVGFWPSPVEKKISGVALTPAQYEQYARTRGNLLRDAVQKIMRLPRYPDIPDEAKKEMFSAALKQTTKEAADAMRVKSVNSDHDILKQRDAAKRAYAAALTAH